MREFAEVDQNGELHAAGNQLHRWTEEGAEVRPIRIEPEPAKPPAKNKRAVPRVAIAIGLGLILTGTPAWWFYSRQFEETDDAQTDGNISAIGPRVPGTVTAVHVVDNQAVNAGDLLVDLDPTDFEVAVAQAKAALAQAEAAFAAESPSVPITET